MTGNPPIEMARILNEMELTQRGYLYSREKHREEIEAGAIRLFMYLLRCKAIEQERDLIFLIL